MMTKKTLRQLYAEHSGYVSNKWSLYLKVYDRLFNDYRDKPIRLLEIGIQNGGSLEIWSKYFSNAEALIGCDINLDCANIRYEDQRIGIVIGNAISPDVCEQVLKCSTQFDIIIDDGSHLSSDIIKSFLQYFPHLAEGGIFIVEDLHCSYWSEFEGGLFDPYSSIAFFKRLTDVINHEHWGVSKARTDILRGIFTKYGCEFDVDALSQVHSVEFINSMCVVRKASAIDNELGRQVIAGSLEQVISGHLSLNDLPYELNAIYLQSNNPWTAREVPPDEGIQKAELEILHLTKTIAEREELIAEIYNSRSWRLTLPFRYIGYKLRKISAAFRFGLALMSSFGGVLMVTKKIVNVIRRDGLSGVSFRVKNAFRHYKSIVGGAFASLQSKTEELDLSIVENGPVITVIMAVYNTPIDMLSAAITSVVDQVYKNWELIIVDDKSTNPEIAKLVERFAKSDHRIKVYFRAENGNISRALNSGINIASADFMAILDHDDTLDKSALYWVARAILENPAVDYIYTDEDKLTKDGRICYGPFWKPDWSPEYLLAMMYTCHLGVYRTSIVRSIGGYRSEYDGAQDFDLTLRFLNQTNNVTHISRVLYHWRVWEQSTAQSINAKPYAQGRARKALEAFLDSRSECFVIDDGPMPGHHQVKFLPKGAPLISIVIPTANGCINVNGKTERHIDAVIKSIFEITNYTNYEIIIVHNGNLLPCQEEYFLAQDKLTLINYRADKFSLSEKINLGSAHANGEYLVIMNDDIRVISEDWLDEMIGMVQRDGVGVVGPKLLFPDGTIQHAGVLLLGGLPGHPYYQWPNNSDGYALGLKVNRNYLAVTGACAITPKWLFDKVGGYSDRYPLNYNDVDYCLKLHRMGYRSVYLANVELYHYEGVSKEGGRSVSNSEIQKFLEDWGSLYSKDPYYNSNLSQNAPYQF
jgi:GT2 family glycosyltransferase